MAYQTFQSEADLMKYINWHISQVKGKIVIQAGHFALIYNQSEDCLIPAISDNIIESDIKLFVENHPYMGNFPLKTWEFALKLVDSNKDKDIKVSIIVNDWQWVPKSVSGDKNNLRKGFYQSQKTLPSDFVKLLKKYKLPEEIILPFSNNKESILFFGEQKMRNKARGEFKAISVNSPNGCAIGYLPFLKYIDADIEAELLISFIPKTCYGPINYGTDYFIDNFSKDLKYVNIFCYGNFLSNFFEQSEVVDYLSNIP